VEPALAEVAPVSLFERMRSVWLKPSRRWWGASMPCWVAGSGWMPKYWKNWKKYSLPLISDETTQDLVQSLEKRFAGNGAVEGLRDLLKEESASGFCLEAAPLNLSDATPFVIMVVGVNGVGKTTTIGKLARQFAAQGKKVVLGAGDTFRAAAAEQLAIWGERAGVDVIRHAEGADPAAVAFAAGPRPPCRCAHPRHRRSTAHQVNLMEELKKLRRVLSREIQALHMNAAG
jgi:fused signal recognition particle receptor